MTTSKAIEFRAYEGADVALFEAEVSDNEEGVLIRVNDVDPGVQLDLEETIDLAAFLNDWLDRALPDACDCGLCELSGGA